MSQCVAVSCSVLQCVHVIPRALENLIIAEQSFMTQCVAVSCNVLQCVEVIPQTLEDAMIAEQSFMSSVLQ